MRSDLDSRGIRDKYRTQTNDSAKQDSRLASLIQNVDAHESSKKVRQAYKSLIGASTQNEINDHELELLTKLNSDELGQWVKNSQKKRLEQLMKQEENEMRQPNFSEN